MLGIGYFLAELNAYLTITGMVVSIVFLYKKIKVKYLSIFFISFLILSGIMDLSTLILGKLGYKNIFLFHFFVPTAFSLMSLTFIYWLPKSKQKLIKIFALIVFLIICIDTFTSNFNHINTRVMNLNAIATLIIAIRYLIWYSENISSSGDFRPHLLITLGVILSTFSSLGYIFWNFLTTYIQFIISDIFNITAYIIFLYALYIFYKSERRILI